jgi:hypothetical protein
VELVALRAINNFSMKIFSAVRTPFPTGEGRGETNNINR